MATRIAAILCGGNGTRLWPLSREKFPKQFHDLAGTGQPLLIDTIERIEPLGIPLMILTGVQHGDSTRTMLSRFNKQAEVVGEPVARDTAAAIALLTILALRKDPNAIVGSFHADHVIKDQAAFRQAVEAAYALAEQHASVVTLGIQPTHPATSYGYLQLADDPDLAPHKRVTKFIEKPNVETATELLLQGNVAWNAGMFFFPAQVMADHFKEHQPELWSKLSTLAADSSNLPEVFSDLPKISIDYAIMEKIDKLLAVPYTGDWADVGSWEDVAERRAQPAAVLESEATGNRYISMAPTSKRAVFLGVDDLIAVDTPDAVLIMKKGSGQGLKNVVQALRDVQAPELLEHSFEERPWGRFEILLNTDNFKSKRLLIYPGKQFSYQRHKHRGEDWTITSGEGTVTIDDVPRVVKAGDHISIPTGTKHRIRNHTESTVLELIEVQTGTYFGEDDIERFEDDFGRV